MRVTEGLLAVEQRNAALVLNRRVMRQGFDAHLAVVQPFLIGLRVGKLRLDLVVGDDAAFFEVDQQHLARLQPPLLDNHFLRHGQHAGFGGEDHAIVRGHDIAGGAQAVAVERGANLTAVGEGDGRRAVPGLHDRRVVFVKGAPLLVHQRVAGPCLWDQQHHRMREAVAALDQEFERIVEAGRVGLALIGNRPKLGNIVPEQRRGHARLPGRHPVHIAAQRVDLAIVADHPVGVRKAPGREGVGRKALMHQRQRGRKPRIVQIEVILAELIGQEHALVHDGTARDGDWVEIDFPAADLLEDAVGNHTPGQVKGALECGFVRNALRPTDEDLPVVRLGGEHDLRQTLVAHGHIAPAEKRKAFFG